MELNIQKVDTSVEHRILGGLIVNTQLIQKVRGLIEPTLMETNAGKIVCQWVVDYYDEAGEAPGKTIMDVFVKRSHELPEAEALEIQKFLQTASNQTVSNVNYLVKVTTEYFKTANLKRLSTSIDSVLASGNVAKAEAMVSSYLAPEIHQDDSVNILDDVSLIQKSFNIEEEELFAMPGDLNKVFGGPFCRGEFIALLAPPKRGKTWWLMDMAMRAFLAGNKVLFISLEMNKEQMTRRFWQYLSGCSRYGEKVENISLFQQTSDDHWILTPATFQTTKVDTNAEVIKARQKQFKEYAKGGDIKLRYYPTGTLSLNDLRAELKNLEVMEGFIPDVIVLDYADIMKPPPGKEKRFQLDEIWLGLRGISLEYNNLVATASQSGRDTVTGDKDATIENIAEAVSKLNHVTRFATLNQNKSDKKLGIYRISCETARDNPGCFDQCVVTSCLSIGRPYMDAHLLGHVELPKDL